MNNRSNRLNLTAFTIASIVIHSVLLLTIMTYELPIPAYQADNYRDQTIKLSLLSTKPSRTESLHTSSHNPGSELTPGSKTTKKSPAVTAKQNTAPKSIAHRQNKTVTKSGSDLELTHSTIASISESDLPESGAIVKDSVAQITEPNEAIVSTQKKQQSEAEQNPVQADALETSKLDAVLGKTFWRYFKYPRIAKKNGWQGQVTVAVRIEANGTLSNIHVVRTSGFPALDSAAINSLKQIALLDGVDKWLRGFHYDTELPILYQLTDS